MLITNGMYTETVTLTPQLATQMLANKHPKQRKLDTKKARSMARDIEGKRWNNNMHWADPIMLSPDGLLMNGQHRCKAVEITKTPIQVDVRYNVPEEYFDFVDNGKPRYTHDFIDVKNATTLTAVARFANSIECGRPLSMAIEGKVLSYENKRIVATRTELIDFIDENKGLLEFCTQQGMRMRTAFQGGSAGMIGCAFWLVSHISNTADTENIIKEFVDSFTDDVPSHRALASGKNLGVGRLLTAAKERTRIRSEYWLALTLAMYDAYFTKKTKITNTDVDKAMKKYASIVDELRGGK